MNSFTIEYIPQKVSNKVKNKSLTHNIFRTQSDHTIMCGFYCIGFIDFVLVGKTVLDYAILFCPNNFKKNGYIIYNYFKDKIWQKKT